MLNIDELRMFANELLELQDKKRKFLTVREIMRKWGMTSTSPVRYRLDRMVENGLVIREGRHYHILEVKNEHC